MRTYDPFPRTPSSVARVRVCANTRGDFVRATTYVNLPAPNAPRVKFVGKGKKRVKRITCK